MRAAIELAVGDDAQADAGADRHEHEVVDPTPDAVCLLAERGEIDVVVEQGVLAERGAQRADQIGAFPVGQVGREPQPAAGGIEHAGRAQHGGQHRLARERLRLGQRLRHLDDARDQQRGARRRAFLQPRQDIAGQVGQRAADPGRADVDRHHVAGPRARLVEARLAPGAALAHAHLLDQPEPFQVAERARHGDLGEARALRELRRGGRRERQQVLVDGPFVALAHEGGAAGDGSAGG